MEQFALGKPSTTLPLVRVLEDMAACCSGGELSRIHPCCALTLLQDELLPTIVYERAI